MTKEKQNKLEANNIRQGSIATDCSAVATQNEPTLCFIDVHIVQITSGNICSPRNFRRIGVILNGEATVKNNFILELGFKDWSQEPQPFDPIRILHYQAMLGFLEKAVLTGDKVDLCVNSKYSSGYRILDVALKY